METSRIRYTVGSTLIYTLMAVLAVVYMVPPLWLVSSSFKGGYIYLDPYILIPEEPKLDGYRFWLGLEPASDNLLPIAVRTVVNFIVTAGVATPLAAMGGYALARWKSRWVDAFLAFTFAIGMMPGFVALVAVYRQLLRMNLIGKIYGLWLVYIAGAVGGWFLLLYRNYFLGIPAEVEDAARVDGCSRFGAFWRVVFPLSRPMMVTTLMAMFQSIWLEYFSASQILRGLPTMGVKLVEYSNRAHSPDIGAATSLSVLVMLPLLILFPFVRKHLTTGLVAGITK